MVINNDVWINLSTKKWKKVELASSNAFRQCTSLSVMFNPEPHFLKEFSSVLRYNNSCKFLAQTTTIPYIVINIIINL